MLIEWAPIDDSHKYFPDYGFLPTLLKLRSPLTVYQLLVPILLPLSFGRCERNKYCLVSLVFQIRIDIMPCCMQPASAMMHCSFPFFPIPFHFHPSKRRRGGRSVTRSPLTTDRGLF